jgi:hypothetical protein
MPRSGAVTLSDLIAPTLTLVCKPCGRKGVHSLARLHIKHGDTRLTDLRSFLTADCPQRARKSIDAQCQAAFDPPPETSRERPRWLDRRLIGRNCPSPGALRLLSRGAE